MNENKELLTINREDIAAPTQLDMLTDPTASFYCSIPNDGTRDSAIKIYNAINNKGESLDENKGKILEIVNVAAHPVNITDETTGEIVEALRIIMVDKNNTNYDAVSQGIASSLQKIFGIVGQPPFNLPLKLKVVEQKTRKGFKTNVIELV